MQRKLPNHPQAIARAARELPAPDRTAAEHSAQVSALIREAIAAEGCLPFSRFMELALYAPGLGYYSAGSRKFGESGDFVTAPEISPLFSRALARQVSEVLQLAGGDVLEFGAGSGAMAADLLQELEQLGMLPERYLILEVSAELRERQRTTLRGRVPALAERVVWLDALPETGFRGAVLANEVLDAMPVHRVRLTDAGPRALCVRECDGQFDWDTRAPDERLAAALEPLQADLARLPVGYETEVNLAAVDWVRAVGGVLKAGAALIIDYGFPRTEYYHPQRSGGTLMCHYRHRAHGDPLVLPGLQDITAHVEYTAVAEAAVAAGLTVNGFANQANFLLANGLLELAAGAREPRQQLELAAQIKKLTLPSEMGELFKVMALSRGIDAPLRGFTLRDERARL